MYQKFNTYGKLKKVMLGSFFDSSFFSTIENDKVRIPLTRIANEINEDLDNFQKILTDFGCEVIRPEIKNDKFDIEDVYLPPLQVRNNFCVVGNKIYQLNPDFRDDLKKYFPNVINLSSDNDSFYKKSMDEAKDNFNKVSGVLYSKEKYFELAGSSWPDYYDFVQGKNSKEQKIISEIESFKSVLEYEMKEVGPLQSPNIINTESCILVDSNEYCDYASWLRTRIDDPRPIKQFTSKAGHVDGCFAVLGNNVILGIDQLINYNKFFPNYHVIKIPETSYQHYIKEYKIMKNKVGGGWWVSGEEYNEIFINFVEKYLKNWTGFVDESIFDVNVLALDEKTICVSNITTEIESQLKKFGIECIVVPWRHRFFVDGGLHCITLDLYREI